MKRRVTIIFRRSIEGELIVDVADEHGDIIETRNFGEYSFQEYEELTEVIRQETAGLEIMDVSLSVN